MNINPNSKFKLTNKKAQYDYFLSDHLEVGLVLHGDEVKSILKGSLSLKESHVKIVNTTNDKPEIWLLNAHCGVEKRDSWNNKPLLMSLHEYNTRPRKLLLHKKQINKFKKALQENGTTLILYEIYVDDNGRIKGTLCLAKGKKQYDKRQVIKERDIQRSTERYG